MHDLLTTEKCNISIIFSTWSFYILFIYILICIYLYTLSISLWI